MADTATNSALLRAINRRRDIDDARWRRPMVALAPEHEPAAARDPTDAIYLREVLVWLQGTYGPDRTHELLETAQRQRGNKYHQSIEPAPSAAAKGRLHRARKALRERFPD